MILLVVEYSNGKVSKSTREMTTVARGAGSRGAHHFPGVGERGSLLSRNRQRSSPTRFWWQTRPELAQYDPEVWASAVAQIASARVRHIRC